MVKKSAAPATAKAPAKKAPAKNAPAKKAPAKEAGDKTREAMADDVPLTSSEAAKPDKAPAGGWGSAADVDNESGGDEPRVGWGLDGQQRMVDEDGKDASEAGKVAEANKPKGPKIKRNAEEDRGVNLTGMTKDLVNGIERIERLNEEIGALKDDAKEVFAELKGKGYSTPIIRKALVRRAMDPDKRKEQDDLLALYEEALRGA